MDIFLRLHSLLWGKWLMIWILCMGMYFMMKNHVIFFHPWKVLKRLLCDVKKNKNQTGGILMAMASSLGIGSMIGVASAIRLGGAGAVFWMLVSAIICSALKYSEVCLASLLRHDGKAGCMIIYKHYLKVPLIGGLFCISAILVSLSMGNMIPAYTIHHTFSMIGYEWLVGIGLLIWFWLLLRNEGKYIQKINEYMIPFICIFYILACIYLIFLHHERVWGVICEIWIDGIKSLKIIEGGIGYGVSQAIRYGVARGVFSHEAGMGSSPLALANVKECDPLIQGLWGIFEVVMDTLVIGSLSALMLMCSDAYVGSVEGMDWLFLSFEEGFGKIGSLFCGWSLFLFGSASMIGWYYYGRICIQYLSRSKWVLKGYHYVYFLVMLCSMYIKIDIAWILSDIFNALMMIPNLISLLIYRKIVIELTKEDW